MTSCEWNKTQSSKVVKLAQCLVAAMLDFDVRAAGNPTLKPLQYNLLTWYLEITSVECTIIILYELYESTNFFFLKVPVSEFWQFIFVIFGLTKFPIPT